MDEVFGEENFIAQIDSFKKTASAIGGVYARRRCDYFLWYAQRHRADSSIGSCFETKLE